MTQTLSKVFGALYASRSCLAELQLVHTPDSDLEYPNGRLLNSKDIRLCFLTGAMDTIFRTLERLDMALCGHMELNVHTTALLELLGRCPSLKSLILRSVFTEIVEEELEPLLHAVCLSQLHLPKLEVFELHQYDVCGFHLNHFLQRHRSTLREVNFNSVALWQQGSWEHILRTFRDEMSLTRLQLVELFEFNEEVILDLDGYQVSAGVTGPEIEMVLNSLL
jgi:hypothetical protein